MNIQGISQGGQVSYTTPEVKGDSNSVKIQGESQGGQETAGAQEITKNSLENLTKKLDSVIGDFGVHSEYEIHEKLNDIMIKIVDDKTGQVISEIPSKKILDMIAKFCEMAGIIVDKKA
jgi:Uncharacterized flagellar protein FlaG